MRILRFILLKEFKQIFRTREMIAIIFGVPLVQMIILGFTITNEVKNVALVIADRDNSRMSREIVRAFQNNDRFEVVGHMTNQNDIEGALQNWQAQMVLVIPQGFSRDLETGRSGEIQILSDGLDGNTAGIALGYAQGILMGIDPPRRIPVTLAGGHGQTPVNMITIEERMWFNEDLDNAQYMIPGIVVVLLTIISMMLSAINLVREKEIGTLEQLMVTPLKKYQILLGKILPFLVLTLGELVIVMTIGQIIFSVELKGSFLLLAGISIIFLFTTLGFGIFISTITSTQQQAMFVSWFFMVFMLLLSGFFIPIENMPPFIQYLTYLNPMRYFLYIVRDIFQKDASLLYLLKDVIPLAIFGLLIFTAGTLKFNKRIS
ncbi:MAG: ABC transporter permease [Calditrichales bacterium]|nr:MAG: ABC transporter permease [Calditrichales bacterium]